MTKEQISLENARANAKKWHKVLEIRDDDGHTLVTVVRGLSLGEEPLVLADALKYAKSPELDAFLASPEIQQKLYRPSKRGIVLVDVADYSTFDTRGQSAILTMFYESLQLAKFSQDVFSREPNIDQIVPTGDGCFIVFKPNVTSRVLQSVFSIQSSFYCHQKKLLRKNGKESITKVLGIRLACHVGDVDFIVDAAGNRNAYGTGMNETARILQYGRPTLKEKLNGEDPTGTAFFSSELDLQAQPLIRRFEQLQSKNIEVKLVDLGKVNAKHDLELELRCFVNLPNHVSFTFDSVIKPDEAPPLTSFSE
ncbi:MAG TPA: hypothetical protein VGI03_04735 [Verrucomicrobiae bacterium]|jgi:hypothetical protein